METNYVGKKVIVRSYGAGVFYGTFVEKEGQTVLLIEHNMSFVRSVADHCNYLADGKIIKNGPAQFVLDDPIIRKD